MKKITRDAKLTIQERVQADHAFAVALLNEAASLFLNGEPVTARLFLRDLVNATVGFEELARETARPSKSLHRMLSARGNPPMDNLTAILQVLRNRLGFLWMLRLSPPEMANKSRAYRLRGISGFY